ncbi:MAG: AsnC family transcriptional regulator, partial [Candidatus Thorarchaeota archaeon]
DIKILHALRKNCRSSYQELSLSLGVSANTVKRRIYRLLDVGIIERFVISQNARYDDQLMDKIAAYPGIVTVGYDDSGSYVVRAEYSGSEGLFNLSSFLRSLQETSEIEVHALPTPRGKDHDFTRSQLEIISILKENPRESILRLAELTGLTLKKVRREMRMIMDSEAISFTLETNLHASRNPVIVMRLILSQKDATPESVIRQLRSEFSDTFYNASFSASMPIIFSFFVLPSLKDVDDIVKTVRNIPAFNIESIGTVHTSKRGLGLREGKLEEMLTGI